MSLKGKEILVHIEPQPVTPDEFEDVLCEKSDSLFADYFNAFLSLPTWPEALAFNSDAGCFEVASDSKRKLAEEIKAAVRAGKPRKAIYKPVTKHSFSTIPLITLEEGETQPAKEIQTSFTVKTLNKEQGVAWIKRERLPSFLESDLYIEYCLAKLLAQCQLLRSTEGVSLKVHHKPKLHSAVEVPEIQEDISFYQKLVVEKQKQKEEERKTKEQEAEQALMKNMFVCLGNTSTTDTEAWVSRVKMSSGVSVTSSPMRPVSAAVSSQRPTSGRPTSSLRPASAFSTTDSGFGSAGKTVSICESNLDVTREENVLSNVDEDVVSTTTINKTVCIIDRSPRPQSVRIRPTYHSDSEDDGMSDTTSLTSKTSKSSAVDQETLGGVSTESLVFDNVNELSSVIVGTVLKYAVAEVTSSDVAEIAEKNYTVRNVYPNAKYCDMTLSSLDHVSLINRLPTTAQPENTTDSLKPKSIHQDLFLGIERTKINLKQKQGKDSDEDSLLNSDDDYDEERDKFFIKRKTKYYALTKRKGIEAFKKFIKGTVGERNWNFWIDVERAKLISNGKQLSHYMVALREHYHKQGAVYELTKETKKQLKLDASSNWTLENLIAAQMKLVQPLLLYWGPRYVLMQKQETDLAQNETYINHQRLQTPQQEPYPNPPTVTLLPLRPKTCMPRVLQQQQKQQSITITCMLDDQPVKDALQKEKEILPATAPPVGMPRRHPVDAKFPKPPAHTPRNAIQGKTSRPKSSSHLTAQAKKSKMHSRPGTAHSYGGEWVKEEEAEMDMTRSVSMMSDRESGYTGGRPTLATSSRPSSAGIGTFSEMKDSTQSRPSTAKSEKASVVSEFLGGRRMETLLQVLGCDRKAGDVIRKFLAHTEKEIWKNSFNFWNDLQDYHGLFYQRIFDDYLLKKKAKTIYSSYIVVGAPRPINCPKSIQENVSLKLEPPFEDLFDSVEEYILDVLFAVWQEIRAAEQKTFEIVELIEEKRHLETKSKYFVNLRKRGIIKEPEKEDSDMMANYNDPVYDESLMDKIPEEFRDYDLAKLVHNRIELEHFRRFLESNYASTDIMCWVDIEAFRRIPHTDEKRRDMKAKEIKVKYLNNKYFFGPNSPAGKEGQEKVLQAGGGRGKMLNERPPTQVLLEAQKYVQKRLEKKWLPLFLATPDFADRQQPHNSVDHVIEDMLLHRKKRSQAIWKGENGEKQAMEGEVTMMPELVDGETGHRVSKSVTFKEEFTEGNWRPLYETSQTRNKKMLESKWVSSSKDVLIFRKALLNPVTSVQFRRFVSVKGDNFENDVLFWQEVQKYKDLCHLHSDKSLIHQKTSTIINCFIDSVIPPALQIDIPQEMADSLLDRRMEGTPYLFREAQMTVFRILYNHWSDFCQFRSQVTDDKVMPTIERHRRRAKAEERKRRKELQDKRDKEIQRKRELGIPVDPDEGDYDPFERLQRLDEEQRLRSSSRVPPVSWSYSSYMKGLDKEDVLNNVDQKTFAAAFRKGGPKSNQGSTGSSRAGSRTSSSASRKRSMNDSDREESKPSILTKPNRRTSNAGSQTDLKPTLKTGTAQT